MSRRRLLGSTLLLCVLIAALALAACGGGGGEGLDSEAVPDSGQDRPTEADTTTALPGEPAVTAPEEAPTTPPRPAEERPRAPEEPQAPSTSEPVVPRTDTIEYTVQAGDTLLDIAGRFGVTAEEIVALNNLVDPERLDIGQLLLIPPQAPSEDEPSPSDGDGGEVPVPSQPDAFDAFVGEAQAYINERGSVDDCLVPLYEQWEMPAVARGDRCNLFDPDQDGVDSLAIVFTDPTPSEIPQTHSALVIYEPITEGEGAGGYRVAYNHQVNYPDAGTGPFDVSVLSVGDVTGDLFPDVVFQDVTCGASTCTTGIYVLQWDDDAQIYQNLTAANPIFIPTLTQISITDATGDEVPDIVAVGGGLGAVGAGPPRESRFVYSGANGQIQLVQAEPFPTTWLVWVVIDGHTAFSAGDYFAAIGHYDAAIEDQSLDEWGAPNERAELVALAQLREALAYAQLGQTASAAAAAQAASAGDGLFANLAGAFLGGYAGTGTLLAGCNTLNNALALRVGEFDDFWATFGYGVPPFHAEDLCPF